MNLFNRVVTTVVLAITAIVSVAVAVAPRAAISTAEQALAATEVALSNQPIVLVGGVLIAIICGLIITLEIRRPASRAVALAKLPEGVAEFATDSVAQRLKHEVELLADVRLVTPRVVSRGSAIDIDVTVQTSPDIDVPNKTSEVYQAIRTNIDQMGLKLGKLRVNMAYAPYSTSLPPKTQ